MTCLPRWREHLTISPLGVSRVLPQVVSCWQEVGVAVCWG
jgi:hypothetical protein